MGNPFQEFVDKVPDDVETEKEYIGLLAEFSSRPETVSLIIETDENDFVKPQYKLILQAMKRLAVNGEDINAITIKQILENMGSLGVVGGYSGLLEHLHTDTCATNPDAFARILRRKRHLRELQKLGAQILELATDAVESPEEIASRASEGALGIVGDSRKIQSCTFEGAAQKATEGRAILETAWEPNLVKFGIPDIDHALRARAGSLGIIAAKPSAGKTSAAIQAMACTPNSILLSFEMEGSEIESRLLASVSGVDTHSIERGVPGGLWVPNDLSNRHYISDWPTMEFAAILARLEQVIRTKQIRVVFVDYFQLLEPPRIKGANMAYQLGRMSTAFKRLAKKTQTAIVLVSQFNRDVADGQRPVLENLRETGQLEQDANWCIMLWTEKATYEPDENRIVNWELAKNRGGRRWVKSKTSFKPHCCQFIEIIDNSAPSSNKWS